MAEGMSKRRPSISVLRLCLLVIVAFLLTPVALFAQTDTTPPVLTGVSIDPNPIDVTNGAQTLTVTTTVTDDLSGTQQVFVALQSPSTGQYLYSSYSSLVSGTNLNGIWQTYLTMPQYSEAGDWTIQYIQLTDNATNNQFLYTSDLQNLGFQTTVNVISQQDVTPPQLTSLSFSPSAVNTSAADR